MPKDSIGGTKDSLSYGISTNKNEHYPPWCLSLKMYCTCTDMEKLLWVAERCINYAICVQNNECTHVHIYEYIYEYNVYMNITNIIYIYEYITESRHTGREGEPGDWGFKRWDILKFLRLYLSIQWLESGNTKQKVVGSAPPTGARGEVFIVAKQGNDLIVYNSNSAFFEKA